MDFLKINDDDTDLHRLGKQHSSLSMTSWHVIYPGGRSSVVMGPITLFSLWIHFAEGLREDLWLWPGEVLLKIDRLFLT